MHARICIVGRFRNSFSEFSIYNGDSDGRPCIGPNGAGGVSGFS